MLFVRVDLSVVFDTAGHEQLLMILQDEYVVRETALAWFRRIRTLFCSVVYHRARFYHVGETGASCYNFQLKSLFVKSMLDALFLSTYTLHLLLYYSY